MKKTNVKILAIVMSVFLLLGILQTTSKATGSFSASCSSESVYVGDTITITVKANNAAGMYSVSASNSNVSLTSGSTSEFLDNSSAIIKYKATKAGTVVITASASDMTDLDDSQKKVTGTKSYAITIKNKTTSSNNSSSSSNSNSSGNNSSSNNSGSTSSSGSSNNTATKTPTFTSVNKTVYTTSSCNLRSSWSTSSSATEVAEGTELKLTGTSTETINGYVWYRVTYNGATKYISSSLVTETKPKEDDNDDDKSSNKNLSSLSIEGIELTPAFDKETTQYTAKVDGDVTELKIDAKAEDSKSKVTIEGNEGLKEGDNVIKVKVTAEDNTTRTYFITVAVGEGTTIDNSLKLSDLKIEKVDFDGIFNPDTYTYKLSLNTYVDKLGITAVPNQADAEVEITGNSNFIAGTNIVTILLTSADGTQTATYQIQVELQGELVEESIGLDWKIYVVLGVIISVTVILIILFIIRYRTTKKERMVENDNNNENEELDVTSKYDNSETENEAKDNEQDDKKENKVLEEQDEQRKENDTEIETLIEKEEEVVEEKKTSRRKKSDVTLDEFLNDSDEEQEKPKKSKGRHSK